MPNLIGPSHHLYFTALQRRRLWLSHLGEAFLGATEPGFKMEEFVQLERRYTAALACLKSTDLGQVLDDTPVNSFLSRVCRGLEDYEQDLFAYIAKTPHELECLERLEQTSMLWGRELTQEMRILLAKANASSRAIPDEHSVRGIFEMLTQVIHGGDFSWKPLLLRRSTEDELIYELRACPHRRAQVDAKAADLGCRVESAVYCGFIQAWVAGAHYERKVRGSYCVDEVRVTYKDL